MYVDSVVEDGWWKLLFSSFVDLVSVVQEASKQASKLRSASPALWQINPDKGRRRLGFTKDGSGEAYGVRGVRRVRVWRCRCRSNRRWFVV